MSTESLGRSTLLLALAAGLSCGPSTPEPDEAPPMEDVAAPTIEAARGALEQALIDRPGVTGVGIGACDGNPCLKVYVVRNDASVISEVADTFGGFAVVVDVSGEIVGGSGGA